MCKRFALPAEAFEEALRKAAALAEAVGVFDGSSMFGLCKDFESVSCLETNKQASSNTRGLH